MQYQTPNLSGLTRGEVCFHFTGTQPLLFDTYNFWTLEQPTRGATPSLPTRPGKNATQGTLCVFCCSNKNGDSGSNLTEIRETVRGKGLSSGVFSSEAFVSQDCSPPPLDSTARQAFKHLRSSAQARRTTWK